MNTNTTFLLTSLVFVFLLVVGVFRLFWKKLLTPPPQTVPSGLTAQKYLELGKRYKTVGWTEEARESLNRAIKADSGDIGKKAQIYLNAYVPRYPTSQYAVQKNIQGYNMRDDEAAGALYQQCIREYPEFEWPYNNLAAVYMKQKKFSQAKDLLMSALKINPNYVSAWLNLSLVYLQEDNKTDARNCAQKALQADPECKQASLYISLIDKSNSLK